MAGIPQPQQALFALLEFLRARLAEAPQAATVVVMAAAPFGPNSFARARLLRQMHACGLIDPQPGAAPREPDRRMSGVAR